MTLAAAWERRSRFRRPDLSGYQPAANVGAAIVPFVGLHPAHTYWASAHPPVCFGNRPDFPDALRLKVLDLFRARRPAEVWDQWQSSEVIDVPITLAAELECIPSLKGAPLGGLFVT